MAIYRLIAIGSFGPDEVKAMVAAYESALTDLQLIDRDDPFTELIAKSIVNVTATGERDPENIKERALNALGVRRTAAWGLKGCRYDYLPASHPTFQFN